MSQTTYNNDPAVAIAGLPGDANSGATQPFTRAAEGTFPAGIAVVMGTVIDKQARVPALTGEVTGPKLLGIVRCQTVREPNGALATQFAAGDEITIQKKGPIWVTVEEAVTAGTDSPFVRFAAGAGGTQLGAIRKSADTATAVAAPGWKFLTSAGIGGLALLDLG